MIVGFYLDAILTSTHKPGVYGDEIWVSAICKGLSEQYPENKYYIFGSNLGYMPHVDVAIYFHRIDKKYGDVNLYVQQNYSDTPEKMKWIIDWFNDKKHVATISGKYARERGWQLLFPAIDDSIYSPERFSLEHAFDICYIGNNIKDEALTNKLLRVAGVKYGIFGRGFNGNMPYDRCKYYYSSSGLSLNIPFSSELDVITAKPFQIASCKGIILSPECPTIKTIFGDSAYWLDLTGDVQGQIIQALNEIKGNQKIMIEKRNKAYETSKVYNYKAQSKLFWEWVQSCL